MTELTFVGERAFKFEENYKKASASAVFVINKDT